MSFASHQSGIVTGLEAKLENAVSDLMHRNDLLTRLYVAVTPKLGGGGLSRELLQEIRDIALPRLDNDQRAICGEPPLPTTGIQL